MRIEVLPSNITPLPDRKTPNAEEGQEDQSGSTFLDVIAQMTAAAGQSEADITGKCILSRQGEAR